MIYQASPYCFPKEEGLILHAWKEKLEAVGWGGENDVSCLNETSIKVQCIYLQYIAL